MPAGLHRYRNRLLNHHVRAAIKGFGNHVVMRSDDRHDIHGIRLRLLDEPGQICENGRTASEETLRQVGDRLRPLRLDVANGNEVPIRQARLVKLVKTVKMACAHSAAANQSQAQPRSLVRQRAFP